MPIDGFAIVAASVSAAAPVGLAVLASAAIRPQWAAATRLIAVVVAVGVALWDVVPRLVEGPVASVAGLFVLGLLVPLALAMLVARIRGGDRRVLGAGAALGALTLHQLVDGLAIGGAWSTGGGLSVSLAVAAHSVPLLGAALHLVGLVGGRERAVRAGLLMGIVSAVGAVAGAVGAPLLPSVEVWLPPVMAGLVLNLVVAGFTHSHSDLPESPPQ
jgi:zinc transporter ZupT